MPTERYWYRKAASELEELSNKYIELAKNQDDEEKREIDWVWAAAVRMAATHLREKSIHRAQNRIGDLTQAEQAIEHQRQSDDEACFICGGDGEVQYKEVPEGGWVDVECENCGGTGTV